MDEKEKMNQRKEKIVEFMREQDYRPLKFEELTTVLAVPAEERDKLSALLEELEQEGAVYKTGKDRYGVPDRMNLIVGRLQGSERGYGFLIPDDELVRDIFIPADGLNGAMHNDRVIARVMIRGSGDKRAEGEIVKILVRANKTIVGTFENTRYLDFVIPDDKRVPGDIFIPRDEINGAKPGYKVVAEIVKWPEKRRNAEGKIIEVIGDSKAPGTDIVSIIKAYGLKEDFPEDVVTQAEDMPDVVSNGLLKGRKDLRDLKMVTIDGEDAKDLDDAVSLEILPDGKYRLGVHIADVSHYVTEGSPLDVEALRRGTSVYLVDRVIPMLPKRLSNGICSLNPHVDRLAFTVMMDLDQSGNVVNHDIFESVINIDERMTYTNVYKLLEAEDKELMERYGYLMEDFSRMKELALILREKRMERGAIDFDFGEAKIILDETGKPIEVRKYDITIANRIIEEFMLVCNETVAEHFHWTGTPFVYRVHEEPDSEKIMAFAEFSANMGYHLKGLNKIHPRALQDILEKVRGTREEAIISTVMLRSLAKARYSPENLGHFGLAAKFYCHFTSPIRRYPDLIIHRLMKEALQGKLTGQREQEMIDRLPEIARLCSEREREADEAERETEDLKKVEFMKEHVGELFDGIVSNVTSFGMFVELDNTIEGLVRVSSMEDDYYVFDDRHFCLLGERTGKRYSIGDEIAVRLVRADTALRQLDFVAEDTHGRKNRKQPSIREDNETHRTHGTKNDGKGYKTGGKGRSPESYKGRGTKKATPGTRSGGRTGAAGRMGATGGTRGADRMNAAGETGTAGRISATGVGTGDEAPVKTNRLKNNVAAKPGRGFRRGGKTNEAGTAGKAGKFLKRGKIEDEENSDKPALKQLKTKKPQKPKKLVK